MFGFILGFAACAVLVFVFAVGVEVGRGKERFEEIRCEGSRVRKRVSGRLDAANKDDFALRSRVSARRVMKGVADHE